MKMVHGNRFYKRFISFVVMLSMMFTFFFFDYHNSLNIVASASNDNLVDGWFYYIKNAKSGKYLTVQHAQATDGQKIIQYHFTGGTNQWWKLEWSGNHGAYAGKYRFITSLDSNKVLSMENATGSSGVKAIIKTKANDIKQLFAFTQQSDTSYRVYTNASNETRVLSVNNGAIYDNTSIIQYTTASDYRDLWLIEPVSGYNSEFAVQYANANYNNDFPAYPSYPSPLEESVDFASQTILAAGEHTVNDGTYNWHVNKLTDTTWESFSNNAWSDSFYFYYFWTNRKSSEGFSKYVVSNNTDSSVYSVGDLVQFACYNTITDTYDGKEVYIITSRPVVSNKGTYLLKGQPNVSNASVNSKFNEYNDGLTSFYKAVFYDMGTDI